ncbi:MAG: purine-nucleoside phosphorylase [Salibacteraceae bacterium]
MLFPEYSEATTHLAMRLPDVSNAVGIVLGTGLGSLAESITDRIEISYEEIPGFPVSTVEGHDGRLICGKLNGRLVLAMKGRFHYYEGYSMQQVAMPVRVMRELGIGDLVLSNASGGMNPEFSVGDIMLITDHINLFPDNPLIGPNNKRVGPRFPDMSSAYDPYFQQIFIDIANELGIPLQKGVYAGVSGPCFETPAEYKYLRIIGADAVGMSTVPECIAARHCGMRVAGLSVITDLGIDGHVETVSHEEVQRAARASEPMMAQLVGEFVKRIRQD